ncbi:MAG: glycosyltransferase family 4 protein [Syntrophomonadaceae bacterium]|nr:glycosyltransferase family 4 protein [Syntrophomonadaceae bacterium]
MKVLMFSWEYPPHMVGGLGQHVYDLSRFLVHQGVCVHIITPRVKYYPDFQEENGVFIHRVGSSYREVENFKSWTFRFNSEAIREAVVINHKVGGFDVIHAHDWLVAYAGRSVAKIFEIPLVTTIHATEHGRNLGLHNRLQQEINEIEKNLALEADRVICCSRYMQEEISSLFGRPLADLKIIPNGVDPEVFQALPERPRFSINDEDKVVFFIGRLVPEKGVCYLLRAMPQVLKAVPEALLVIGGRGPQQKELERLVQNMDLDDRVLFTGFIYNEERNYVYNKARVAVFPSLYEPFGIVALEAMATHTPVVVANAGGLSEIVQDEVTGLKVTPGSEGELAEAIIRILTDDGLAERLLNNATQEIDSVYKWDVIARSTADVYEQVQTRRQIGIRS